MHRRSFVCGERVERVERVELAKCAERRASRPAHHRTADPRISQGPRVRADGATTRARRVVLLRAREARLRSSTIFGALLFAAAILGGCDSPKPAATAPAPTSDVPTTTATLPAPPASDSASATPTPTQSPATPAPSGQPSGQPSALSPDESKWVGSWSSASCGDRKFERKLTLKADKTFMAQDLVSPCPPKVQCIWAGIVSWSGTWALDDKGALLTKTSGSRDPSGKSKTDAPVRLVWDKASSAPAEQDAAGASCPYAKGGEVKGGTPKGSDPPAKM